MKITGLKRNYHLKTGKKRPVRITSLQLYGTMGHDDHK